MANDNAFEPEFGPNGAVMNAPSMTPEMRAKFDQIGKIPPRVELLRLVLYFAALGAAVLAIVWFLNSGRGILRESPWWAGALTGAVAVVAVGVLWRAVQQGLLRWEIMRSETRVLTAPLWLRLTLFAANVLIIAVYAGLLVTLVANPHLELSKYLLVPWLIMLLVWSLNAPLKWWAKRRGWIIQPPA